MQRDAEFIWTPEQEIASDLSFRDFIGKGPQRREDGQNRWYLFRKTFSLANVPTTASMDITADGRYILFVNGQRIGRGPSRCSPYYQRFDTYELSRSLRQGENTIAVLVHVYGLDTAWYETVKDYWQALFGDGGLYCVCQIDDAQIVSDTSWRCSEALAWNRDTPQSGWGQDFIEDHDARKMPHGWMDADFDDSGWQATQLLLDRRDENDRAKGFGPVRAFPTLLPRGIPHLAEELVSAAHVMTSYGVSPNPELPIKERLYDESLQACPEGCIESRDAMLVDDPSTTTIRTKPGCDVSVLIAFDTLHAGFPFIDIEADGGEIIEVAVAETYLGEFDNTQTGAPRLALQTFLDCAHVFRYTARPGRQRFEKFEWTAVRYLQLVIRNAANGVRIRHVGSNAIYYPVQNQGSYTCSDDFLNQLWKIGRHTVLQCSHDAWEDCPGREKRQWAGDGAVRYPIGAAAFGSSIQALDRRFLLQCLESQRTDGLVQMYAPGDHKTYGVVIPDYSLQFILTAYEYMMHNADLETLEIVLPGMQRILAWYAQHVGERQLLVDIPYWHFIEWAHVGRCGAATSINALYAVSLGQAAEIAARLGYDRLAKRYEKEAALVRNAINEQLWDAKREVYVDGVDPQSGKQFVRVSQQANALLVAFDIAPAERCASIIDYITDVDRVKLTSVPPIVPAGYPFDVEHDVVRCNTFFSHFLYCALAAQGRFDLVLQQFREYYGPMLATGTTTLWESFDPTASLCHAFSAAPVYHLSAHSLGVRPTEPGFSHFIVAPQFHDLSFAEGGYPTPSGVIAVKWQRQEGEVAVRIEVPADISGTFVVPNGFRLRNGAAQLKVGRNELNLVEAGENE